MYAIVKAGGHQEKVEVGDVILVNRLEAKKGETVEFPVALVVDGAKVTLGPRISPRCPPRVKSLTTRPRAPRSTS